MADNTGSNLGTGHVVFSSKVGDDLQFNSDWYSSITPLIKSPSFI